MIDIYKTSTENDKHLYDMIRGVSAKEFGLCIKKIIIATDLKRQIGFETDDSIACVAFVAFLGDKCLLAGNLETYKEILHELGYFCFGLFTWVAFMSFNHKLCRSMGISEDFYMELIRHIGEDANSIRTHFPSIDADTSNAKIMSELYNRTRC